MNILETYYTYAKLAQAAYIDLSKEASPTDAESIVNVGERDERVPRALGNRLFNSLTNANWTLLSPYYVTDPLTGHSDPASGFAGMLLTHPEYGKVLAIAGTQPTENVQAYFDLLNADLVQIGLLGAALNQLVSLFDYVQVLRAPPGATNVLQLEVKTGTLPPDTPYVTQLLPLPRFYWLEAHNDGIGQGGLAPGETLTVTGHSLGGHLAALAVALFPDLFTAAYTFNAPGYNPLTSLAAQPGGADDLLSLFQPFTTTAPAPVASVAGRITTLEAEDAIPGDDNDVISGNFTGSPFSGEQYLTTERVTHDIGHLMDSLALQSLMGRMNEDLTPEQAGRVLEATTTKTDEAYERLIEDLHAAIQGSRIVLNTTGPSFSLTGGDFVIRSEFYERVVELEDAVAQTSELRLETLVDRTASDLQGLGETTGPDGLAYRYALQELNPFVLLGANYEALHNALGQLERYEATTRTGTLTDRWLEDRADFLYYKIAAGVGDTESMGSPWAEYLGTPFRYYEDRRTEPYHLYAGANPGVVQVPRSSLSNILFGGDAPDNLTGGNFADRLYGGAGNDFLEGGQGNDYLEGGYGEDIYHYRPGDGVDDILDIAGRGRVLYTDAGGTQRLLTGGRQSAEGSTLYQSSTDPAIQYRRGTDGTLTVLIGGADALRILDYRAGDLGIVLQEVSGDFFLQRSAFRCNFREAQRARYCD